MGSKMYRYSWILLVWFKQVSRFIPLLFLSLFGREDMNEHERKCSKRREGSWYTSWPLSVLKNIHDHRLLNLSISWWWYSFIASYRLWFKWFSSFSFPLLLDSFWVSFLSYSLVFFHSLISLAITIITIVLLFLLLFHTSPLLSFLFLDVPFLDTTDEKECVSKEEYQKRVDDDDGDRVSSFHTMILFCSLEDMKKFFTSHSFLFGSLSFWEEAFIVVFLTLDSRCWCHSFPFEFESELDSLLHFSSSSCVTEERKNTRFLVSFTSFLLSLPSPFIHVILLPSFVLLSCCLPSRLENESGRELD